MLMTIMGTQRKLDSELYVENMEAFFHYYQDFLVSRTEDRDLLLLQTSRSKARFILD